jgi:hypothetical protein
MKKSKSASHHHAHMRAATRRSAAARHDLPFEVRRSRIHGRGVYATRAIPVGTRVVEYEGERISNEEADARYDHKGADDGHTFLFVIDNRTCIDAGVGGNEARYINHSCDPNCETIIEDGRVYIDAIRTSGLARSSATTINSPGKVPTSPPSSRYTPAAAAPRSAAARCSIPCRSTASASRGAGRGAGTEPRLPAGA